MVPPFSHALPVSDWLFRENLYVTHIGWERVEPDENYPQPQAPIYYFNWTVGRVLPEYCLAWCLKGSGELETKTNIQQILPGEAFFYHAGEWHRHRPLPETGWEICWIHCTGALPHQWNKQKEFRMQGNKPLIADRDLFDAQFQRLLRSAHGNPGYNSMEFSYQAVGLFSHFVADAHALEPDSASTATNRVWRAKDFIRNHTHESISVTDVATHVGCNRRTLEIQFKNTAGRTVLDEIQLCRAERARALLIETNLPIKEVIHRSGFQSREQMRLVFRKLLGITPSDARR